MSKIKYFEFDDSALSDSEKKVIELLKEVGEIVHKIWEEQVGGENEATSLYPKGLTAQEVLQAGESEPELLSPYTVVKREGDELIAVPYREEYREDLDKIIELLGEAAEITEDSNLKNYLSNLKERFDKGQFEDALIAYLTETESKIDVLMGPLETYEDKLLGRKKTFQFNLRVLKEDHMKEMDEMIELMKGIQVLKPQSTVAAGLEESKIKTRIDDVLVFSGRQANRLVSSTNLPNESNLVEKYGVKIVVYTTSMFEKFDKQLQPLLQHFPGLDLENRIDSMKLATVRFIALHEITEGVIKFPSSQSRLQQYYDYVRELNADVLGVHSAVYHILSGIIDNEQYKELLITFLLFAIDVCNSFDKEGILEEYAKGSAVAFNFFFSTGSLKEAGDGKLEVDFVKLTRDMEALSSITLELLQSGTVADAQRLFDEYGSYDVFKKLPKVEISE